MLPKSLIFHVRTRRVSSCNQPRVSMAADDELKDDPIVDAVLDIRFTASELQEVVVGRLSDIPQWRNTHKTRLPAADIPEPVRAANPSLLHLPTVEVKGVADVGVVRIGGNIITLHFLDRYAGWPKAFPTIRGVIDSTFQALPGITVTRLGLRYVNLFTATRHHVGSVYDLAVKVAVAEKALESNMNLTFQETVSSEHTCTTRLSSRNFLVGKIPDDASAALDLEVFTPTSYTASKPDAVQKWVDDAHTIEKRSFRRLLPDDLYLKLRGATLNDRF
jgi:uncharacterized protein (TIGR04255 family)